MKKNPKEDIEKQFKYLQNYFEETGKGVLDGLKPGETSLKDFFIFLFGNSTQNSILLLLPTSTTHFEICFVLPIVPCYFH